MIAYMGQDTKNLDQIVTQPNPQSYIKSNLSIMNQIVSTIHSIKSHSSPNFF